MVKTRAWRLCATVLAIGLVAAACGDDDEGAVDAEPVASTTSTSMAEASATPSSSTTTTSTTQPVATTVSCTLPDEALIEAGSLTVGTWLPETVAGDSFDSDVVYATAEALGFAAEDVRFVPIDFYAPFLDGLERTYDVAVGNYSITEAREELADFSDGYDRKELVLVATESSPASGATTVTELRAATLGRIHNPELPFSQDYIELEIQPSNEAIAFEVPAAFPTAGAALADGSIDGMVMGEGEALWSTGEDLQHASIIAALPVSDSAVEEIGMAFEEDSELVGCFNEALALVAEAGTLEELESEWYPELAEIPTLSA